MKLIMEKLHLPFCATNAFNAESIWISQRNRPSSKPSNAIVRSNFKINGVYEGEAFFTCGTGRTDSDFNPRYEQRINNDNTLEINGSVNEILFLNEEYMILLPQLELENK